MYNNNWIDRVHTTPLIPHTYINKKRQLWVLHYNLQEQSMGLFTFYKG